MRHGSLCTGYGGLDLAAQAVFGGELAWWSDVEPAAVTLMEHHAPGIPNLGDVKLVDWSEVEPVDIVTAGYPCQPYSTAGKGKGVDDPRHLWPWIAKGIGILRPRGIVLENVPGHLRNGFASVLGDLAKIGYDTTWATVRASHVGAAHRRERLFAVAADARHGPLTDWARRPRWQGREWPTERGGSPGDTPVVDWRGYKSAIRRWESHLGRRAPWPTVLEGSVVKVSPWFGEWLMGLPEGRVTGVPGLSINQQLWLIGNGVVPQQGAYAIRRLVGYP